MLMHFLRVLNINIINNLIKLGFGFVDNEDYWGCTARTTGHPDTFTGARMAENSSRGKSHGMSENQTASSTASTWKTRASTRQCWPPPIATLRKNSCATCERKEQLDWPRSKSALISGASRKVSSLILILKSYIVKNRKKISHLIRPINNFQFLLKGELDLLLQNGASSANYTYNLKVRISSFHEKPISDFFHLPI